MTTEGLILLVAPATRLPRHGEDEPSRVAGFGAAFPRAIDCASRRGRPIARHYPRRSRCRSTRLRRAFTKPAFYGHPTLSQFYRDLYCSSFVLSQVPWT